MQEAEDSSSIIGCIRVRRHGAISRQVKLRQPVVAVLTNIPEGEQAISAVASPLLEGADRVPEMDLVIPDGVSFGAECFVVAAVVAGLLPNGSDRVAIIPVIGDYDPSRFPVVYGEAHGSWATATSPAAIAFLQRKATEWAPVDAELLRRSLSPGLAHDQRVYAWRRLVAALGFGGLIRVRRSGGFRLDHVLPILVAQELGFVPEKRLPARWRRFHPAWRSLALPAGWGRAAPDAKTDDEP